MTKTGASLEWGSGGSDHGGDGTREILPAGRPQAHYTFSESNRDSSDSALCALSRMESTLQHQRVCIGSMQQ